MAERAIAHLDGLINVGPKLDAWNCVHTVPPTRVRLSSIDSDVTVQVFETGDPHGGNLLAIKPTATVRQIQLREQDQLGHSAPIPETSVVFYAEAALASLARQTR